MISESVSCALKATVNIGPSTVMLPEVTMTGPVVAPSDKVATTCVSLQVLIAAVPPLKLTVLLPCVAPNPDPLIVTLPPGAPVVGDTPAISESGAAGLVLLVRRYPEALERLEKVSAG